MKKREKMNGTVKKERKGKENRGRGDIKHKERKGKGRKRN